MRKAILSAFEIAARIDPHSHLENLAPRFDDGRPRQCRQASWFGFYALRAATRGVLISTNFVSAARVLSLDGLNAPAVSNAYAAAFQLLHSYLALEGRVYCDDRKESRDAMVVFANGRWTVEGVHRGHASMWSQLERTVVETGGQALPSYFEYLFETICPRQYDKSIPLADLIRKRREEPRHGEIPMSQRLPEFLQTIAEVRHWANYYGFGDDAGLVDALINGDATGGDLSITAKAFTAFALDFIEDMANRIMGIMSEISWTKPSRDLWCLTTYWPYFDPPRFEQLGGSLSKTLVELWDVAHPTDSADAG